MKIAIKLKPKLRCLSTFAKAVLCLLKTMVRRQKTVFKGGEWWETLFGLSQNGVIDFKSAELVSVDLTSPEGRAGF